MPSSESQEKISLIAETIAAVYGCDEKFYKRKGVPEEARVPQWVFFFILNEHLGMTQKSICELMGRAFNHRHASDFKSNALAHPRARTLLFAVQEKLKGRL